MDGILSQDEINALLSGMDLSGDMGSQDEPEPAPASSATVDESLLTDTEKDAIGEIANISMGSSATTLYSLVNRKVNITTPVVTLANWASVIEDYQRPCVFIQIRYTAGLDGSNIMVLKEHDVKVITDLMMGGDGSNTDGELGELHLSAISEAMNQMMGAAATSLSTMLGKMIDISPPEASRVDLQDFHNGDDIAEFLAGTFVKIAFRMQIEDLVDSTIMQLYPIDFAKSLYDMFMGTQMPEAEPEPAPTPAAPEPQPYVPPVAEMPQQDMSQMNMGMGMPQPDMNPMGMNPMGMNMGMNPMGMNPMGMNPAGMPQMGMAPMGMMNMQMPQMGMGMMGMPQESMNIQPAQFQSFNSGAGAVAGQENIGLIMDVPLEVTVELGRTKKSIAEILDFAPGTIIELDKIAGEPIDVLVNGKFVAKGEVVVIEESFGIRVTEIIK
ncbi:MAG: flagellar motor switch phosphatase FliY [Lachnospiraceae bacterium]|nr:flagellar motor switch phosphatase FliY [Lachnospiraceae bacterium]